MCVICKQTSRSGATQDPSAEQRAAYLPRPAGALPGTAGTHPEPRGSAHSPPVAEAELSGELWLPLQTCRRTFVLSMPGYQNTLVGISTETLVCRKHTDQKCVSKTMTVVWKKIPATFSEGYNSQPLVGRVQMSARNDGSTSAAPGHHWSLTALLGSWAALLPLSSTVW